jgi:hypothetical protein
MIIYSKGYLAKNQKILNNLNSNLSVPMQQALDKIQQHFKGSSS